MGACKAIWITAGTVFRGVELILGLGQTPGGPRPPPAFISARTLPPTELERQVSPVALPFPLRRLT